MKRKINNSHLAFIAIGLVVILSIIAIVNILFVVNTYGSSIVTDTKNIVDNTMAEAKKLGQPKEVIYITQIKIDSVNETNTDDKYTVYNAYCEQFNEEIEIKFENKYVKQIKEGWNYRAARVASTVDTEKVTYEFVFDNEAAGISLRNLDYSIGNKIDGIVVDTKESMNDLGKTVYLVKISIQDDNTAMYVTLNTTEKKFKTYEVGKTASVTRHEARVGIDTLVVTYID